MIKDTFDFVNRILRTTNDGGYMVSFDIVSLFTNIPLNETIEIIIKRAFKKSERFHNFDKKQFTKFLRIATKESHFHFLGLFFVQIDGVYVAMVSPLALTFANIFIDEFERKHMNEF